METCPNCKHTMRWYMEYFCGNPYMGYHCDCCGYDTKNIQNVVTATNTSVPISYQKGVYENECK